MLKLGAIGALAILCVSCSSPSFPLDASIQKDATIEDLDGSTETDAGSGSDTGSLTGCEPTIRCASVCTATASDLDNCGGCGVVCDEVESAIRSCELGRCVETCFPGWDDCDHDLGRPLSNGCEADLHFDALNCGQCGTACSVDQLCAGFVCVDRTRLPGESCSTAIVLSLGTNIEPYAVFTNDYLSVIPSCGPPQAPIVGGDLVLSYTPSFDGFAYVALDGSFDTYTMLISDAPCGTTVPEHACVAELAYPTISALFPVVANTPYSIYVINTSFFLGTPLPNPVSIQVLETDCDSASASPIISLDPPVGATTADLLPILTMTFDQPLADIGVVTLSGDLGTSRSYDLSSLQLNLSSDRRTLTLRLESFVNPGERITVGWTLQTRCGRPIAPPTPAWTFSLPTPPCLPGVAGVVGAESSTIAELGLLVPPTYFVTADAAPNGWLYFGGPEALYRVSKDGARTEDLQRPSRLGPLPFGSRAGLVVGSEVYLVSTSTGSILPVDDRVLRVTKDGGQTWSIQSIAQWTSAAPSDELGGIAEDGGRQYVITKERTPGAATEIWSFDPSSPSLPAPAVLEAFIPGYTKCSGLAIDAGSYYTACDSRAEPVLRIDRTTLATTELTTAYDVADEANALQGDDLDGDDIFDILYVQTSSREGYYVCDPAGTAFAMTGFRLPGYNFYTHGLALDPTVPVLWMMDWSYFQILRIE